MTNFLQLIVGGVALGMQYALVALGFVIIFKATHVINFAQGGFVMLGAYLTYQYSALWGLPFFVGVLLASSVSLHLLGRHGRRHQELLHDRPEVKEWLAGPYTWTTPAVLAFILVLAVIVPSVGAWPMLLLFVDGIVENRIVQRRKAAAAG